MKRRQIVFVTAVFTALLTAFLVERTSRLEALDPSDFRPPSGLAFAPLESPLGALDLRGIVVDHGGAPAAEVAVHLVAESSAPDVALPLHWATTGADGRFEIHGLESGAYRVTLLQPGHPVVPFELHLPDDAGEAGHEVSWTLPAPLAPIRSLPEIERAELAGRILPAAQAPEEEAPSLAGYGVWLRPSEEVDPLSGAVERLVLTGSDGGFVVPDLTVATYDAFVLPAWAVGGTWPVLARARIEHSAGGGAGPLLLGLAAGEIVGRVLDREGRPVAGALVQVRPRDENTRIWPAESTDPEGAFRVRDLPAGSYALDVQAGSARLEQVVEVEAGQRTEAALPPVDPAGP